MGCGPPMVARRRAEASKEGVHLSTSTFWPPWIGHPKWWGLVRESKLERIGNKARRIAFHLTWRMSSAKVGLRLDGGSPNTNDKGMAFTHCVHMGGKVLGMTELWFCRIPVALVWGVGCVRVPCLRYVSHRPGSRPRPALQCGATV